MNQIHLKLAHEKYTPDWLRSFKGCEHYSDEDAMLILNSLKTLANIILQNASNADHIAGDFAPPSNIEDSRSSQAA